MSSCHSRNTIVRFCWFNMVVSFGPTPKLPRNVILLRDEGCKFPVCFVSHITEVKVTILVAVIFLSFFLSFCCCCLLLLLLLIILLLILYFIYLLFCLFIYLLL